MERIDFKVEKLTSEMKISDYLKKRLGFSGSLITKVKFGGVKLNETIITMRATVKNGDIITVSFPDEESENVKPICIPLDIVYEDEHLLAVNKPKDMVVHPAVGNKSGTLVNAMLGHSELSDINGEFRPRNRT